MEESRKMILDIIDEQKWVQVISRFMDVLRINICTIDCSGRIALPFHKEKYGGAFLSDHSLGLNFSFDNQFFTKHFHPLGNYWEAVSIYDLHYFAVPIRSEKDHIAGYIMVGPVILNKKLEDSVYQKSAQKQGVDPAKILGELHEVRVVSYLVLDSILDLLAAMARDAVELGLERKKLAQLHLKKDQLPKEFGHLAEEIYTAVRIDELLVSLLDVALKITNTECGSIMVFDKDKDELAVKVSRGLEDGKLKSKKVRMGEGIAGIAAQEKSSFFISGQKADNRIKHLLKRPDIVESFVMPLIAKNKIFGVLNLSTKTKQAKISDHLESLQYFSKIVSAAL